MIQVQEASNANAAAAALESAREEIWNLDGGWRSAHGLSPGDRNNPKYVGGVLPAGTGPFITIDGGFIPYKLLRTIPDIVARHLAEAGVEDAVIASPPLGGPLLALPRVPRAVVLRLYPEPPARRGHRSRVPVQWLEEACHWLGDGAEDELLASVGSVEFPLRQRDARALLEQCSELEAQRSLLVAGDLDKRLRAVNGCFLGGSPFLAGLALAVGGPAVSAQERVEEMARFQQVARRFAEGLRYAFIAAKPNFSSFTAASWRSGWYREADVERLLDELVLDAFPYQVLGRRHLARLGGPPRDGRPFPGDRLELELGESSDWLATAQERARELLAPCLLKAGEAAPIREEREAAGRSPHPQRALAPLPVRDQAGGREVEAQAEAELSRIRAQAEQGSRAAAPLSPAELMARALDEEGLAFESPAFAELVGQVAGPPAPDTPGELRRTPAARPARSCCTCFPRPTGQSRSPYWTQRIDGLRKSRPVRPSLRLAWSRSCWNFHWQRPERFASSLGALGQG